jgi:hypothetical protein
MLCLLQGCQTSRETRLISRLAGMTLYSLDLCAIYSVFYNIPVEYPLLAILRPILRPILVCTLGCMGTGNWWVRVWV